jgi:hypothetical protein
LLAMSSICVRMESLMSWCWPAAMRRRSCSIGSLPRISTCVLGAAAAAAAGKRWRRQHSEECQSGPSALLYVGVMRCLT